MMKGTLFPVQKRIRRRVDPWERNSSRLQEIKVLIKILFWGGDLGVTCKGKAGRMLPGGRVSRRQGL